MTRTELEALRDIKRVLDAGFDRDTMSHKPTAVIDAHQRVNALWQDAETKQRKPKAATNE